MATRTSIELYPDGCRLVEVDLPTRRRGPVAGDTRVRTFISDLPFADDEALLVQTLSGLRERRKLARAAWVTIWGLRSVQQFLKLPPAKPADLEALATREARKQLAPLETDGEHATVGIVIGSEVQVGSQRRREISLVGVSSADVRRRIQPVVDAGFVVEGVLTPALALTAVARAQRDLLDDSAAAYVALTARATCLAIIRGGTLLFAREIPWGHDRDTSPAAEEALNARLASELKRSVLYFKQTFRAAVDSVVLCGDMPNLRTLTGPLGTAVDLPVKTLDSLVGIDALALPEPADQFRADVAGLQLAIATAADPKPAVNLLPATIRLSRDARTQRMRLVGAVAASIALIGAGYMQVQRSASGYERERRQMQQELARLEPEAIRLDELRQAYALGTARRAAIGAFDSQGPRMSRFLEAVAAAAPNDIVLTSIAAAPDGMYWRATVTGVAITEDVAAAQAGVNALIGGVSGSPFVGLPVRPPSLRVVSGTATEGVSPTEQMTAIPEGMSGVEFELQFSLAK